MRRRTKTTYRPSTWEEEAEAATDGDGMDVEERRSSASASSSSSPSTCRADGRDAASDLRPCYVRMGPVSAASGSAFLEVGLTKVVCSVFGPRANAAADGFSGRGNLHCDFKFAPFARAGERTEAGQTDRERELSRQLQQALLPAVRLTLYPKSTIDVFCLVLEDGGGALPAAINCAAVALVDAAVEMLDTVAACAVCTTAAAATDQHHLSLLDPSHEEEAIAPAELTISMMPSHQRVTHMEQTGELSPALLCAALELAMGGCARVQATLTASIVASATASAEAEGK